MHLQRLGGVYGDLVGAGPVLHTAKNVLEGACSQGLCC